ncbi:DUF309 domain-containing protein [Planctomicrobium sp. SH661]|uniref:DUF309 domain-containing protein n=1 Tax=Planctomicrobium sp. SH661 TaxID=3448124 RepID=UPI003F5C75CB
MSGQSPPDEPLFPQDLPKYTYVPGVSPHPVSDPAGHSFGAARPIPTGSLQPGANLFDHGYYWEAHEAWEAEWLAAGRTGPDADVIKGLIKLAACGVKCLEQNEAGARRHAQRGAELFRQAANMNPQILSTGCIERLSLRATQLASQATAATTDQQSLTIQGGVPVLGPLPELS